ncbi:MAG: DNA-3-methyladenine glycosylase family protein [Janthinobacterium lividum]
MPLTFLCSYQPPYDWESFLKFLILHLTKGVEAIHENCYVRTVHYGHYKGWLKVKHCPEQQALEITLSCDLKVVQKEILQQINFMFDLDHNPNVTIAFFQNHKLLSNIIKNYPGLRVPGSFNGFELAMRAILGQQISVKAATTLAGRITSAFGDEIKTPWTGLTHLHPTAGTIAQLSINDLTNLGVIQKRAHCIIRLAQEIINADLKLKSGADPETTLKKLMTLPGIGDWTAHYIALRALKWNDAFLKSDLAIKQILGGISASQAEKISQEWRPWRSYATLYLWQNAICTAADKIASVKIS